MTTSVRPRIRRPEIINLILEYYSDLLIIYWLDTLTFWLLLPVSDAGR